MRFLALVLSLLTVSCATTGVLPPTHARLVQLMAERLELGKEVAWSKYHSGAPIRDPKREDALMQSLVAEGEKLGVPATATTHFFEAQMQASRVMQQELISGWRTGQERPTYSAKNLVSEIRPRLNTVSRQMLVELRKPTDWTPEAIAQAATELQSRGFSTPVATVAVGCLPALPK